MFESTKSKLKLLIISGISLSLTLFSFASAVEVVFAQDLPVVQSIKPYPNQAGIQNTLLNYDYESGQQTVFKEGIVGSPEYMYLDTINTRLKLIEGNKINDQWYSRDFGAGYVELNKDPANNPVDLLIYAKKSWMSVPIPENLNVDDSVTMIYTKGLRSQFKVISKKSINNNETFVPSSTEERNIVFLINDKSRNTNYIYTLEFNSNL